MPVHHIIRNNACEITLDTPPVNVIGQATRAGLMTALDAAEAAGVARIIITGAGRAFAAGADASEFDSAPQEPHLPDVLKRLEQMNAIAAINGVALGGGLEIALACRCRIAAPNAKLGLPEVTLGVVPGAGGTQRLPRLLGIAEAAQLITSGRQISAIEASPIGLIDVIEDDPMQAARDLPDAVLDGFLSACDRPRPAADPQAVEATRAGLARRAKGQIAPGAALDLIAITAHATFEDGLAAERAQFLKLRQSDQARALRHVFFAESTAKSRARTLGQDPAPVRSAVVVGGGTMGAGIAYALDRIGVVTTLVEVSADAAARAQVNIDRLFDEAVQRGKATAMVAAQGKARLTVVVGYDDLPAADIAIEAVFEDLTVKKQVFAALDAALPETAILATNTSYLDVNRIFEGIRAPHRCLGLHFFSPAHVMKLLEVIRADTTDTATMATSLALAAKLGKIPVEAGVCDGFIGNRILTRYRQICDVMLLEGALPAQIDAALTDFGMAMGPYAVQDLSGLDIAYANRQRKNLRHMDGIRYIPIADRMVEVLKRLGRKTGAGWYDYPPGVAPQASGLVDRLVIASSNDAGVLRRPFTDQEIVERAMAAMIDEALRILEEGIARRPADIDLVLVHGYGFPRWRGGVMHYADTIGLAALRDRIAAYAQDDPLSWGMTPFLDRLVKDCSTLAALNGSPVQPRL